MRNAWKVRFAGLPPVRRVAAGIESRTNSASRDVDTSGWRDALANDGCAMRDAKRSSPYTRKTRAISPAG